MKGEDEGLTCELLDVPLAVGPLIRLVAQPIKHHVVATLRREVPDWKSDNIAVGGIEGEDDLGRLQKLEANDAFPHLRVGPDA